MTPSVGAGPTPTAWLASGSQSDPKLRTKRPAAVGRRPTVWRLVFLLVAAAIGAYSVLHTAHLMKLFINEPVLPDWEQHRIAAQRIANGISPYFTEDWYRFRWSPVAAWLMVPITALGSWVWTIAQFGSLLLLPRSLALFSLLAFPFWADIQAGNIMVFLFVAAFHAIRGSSVAAVIVVALGVLVPRPLLIPLLLYVAASYPKLRVAFSVMIISSLIGAVLTGYHADWVAALLQTGGEESQRLGGQSLPGWPAINMGAAILLLWVGFPGMAGLAVSPYWLPYYGLLPLADRWERIKDASRDRI